MSSGLEGTGSEIGELSIKDLPTQTKYTLHQYVLGFRIMPNMPKYLVNIDIILFYFDVCVLLALLIFDIFQSIELVCAVNIQHGVSVA